MAGVSVLAEPAYTAGEWASMLRSPTKNKSYQSATRLGAPIRDFLAWKQLSGAAERTLDQYERDLSACGFQFPDLPIEEWTEHECLSALMSFPAKSRRRASAPLKGLFAWAVAWGWRPDNPMLKMPRLREGDREPYDIFDIDEETMLCSLAELRDRVPMMLLFRTGLRLGEACRLCWRDIDLAAGRLIVRRSKSRKGRIIPVDSGTLTALSELATLEGLNPPDHIWYTRPRGLTVSRVNEDGSTSFHLWWKNCLEEAGVRYRKAHLTRHTFATSYLRAGGRLERLSRILGHSSTAITSEFYVHFVTDDLAEDLNMVLKQRGLIS
jgi:integrase